MASNEKIIENCKKKIIVTKKRKIQEACIINDDRICPFCLENVSTILIYRHIRMCLYVFEKHCNLPHKCYHENIENIEKEEQRIEIENPLIDKLFPFNCSNYFDLIEITQRKQEEKLKTKKACSLYGKIYHISLSYEGSKNDMNLIDFGENHFWTCLDESEYICGDKGFRGLQHYWKNIVLPFIGSDLNEKEKEFNNEVASIRIVVENVFSQIKKWKVCKHPFRTNINNIEKAKVWHNKVWVVVGGLFNDFVAPIRNN
ncbi:hypothetical protein ABK040_008110 [Willaertia magna]